MKSYLKNNCLTISILLGIFSYVPLAIANDYSPYPDPIGEYISDHAGLLTKDEAEKIERRLKQVERGSNVEIIVVIIDSMTDYPGTANKSIESFATGLFNAYGIGNMPKNDGILFLLAKSDRKVRIELGAGYGHSRDRNAEQIINSIIPTLKGGNYVAGITDGTEAIIEEFADIRFGFPWHILFMGIAALILLIVGYSFLENGKKGWGYVFIGLGIVLILFVVFLSVQFFRYQSSRSTGGFGGGFSGGGGASGGF